ncbi:hypothetical protein [Rhizobium leguminosarum]
MNEISPAEERQTALRWIPRQKDGESLCLHFTGGVRAARIEGDRWALEPVLVDGRPASTGFYSRRDLEVMERSLGLVAIAFQHAGWQGGSYYSNWVPIIPGQKNHMLGAADVWRNITSQIGRQRRGHRLRQLVSPSREDVAAILDDQEPDEKLAQFIALSLRGLDIGIEEISTFYHEQLVDLMADGKLNGERTSGTLDHMLYAHVHSFFLHAGAARDYLGSLIAFRLGEDANVDSLTLLCKKLRSRHIGSDSLLDVLFDQGLVAESKQKGMWVSAGWMKELSELRNLFTHRRPYGSLSCEHWGSAFSLSDTRQLYRYRRPFDIYAGDDILDLVVRQYRQIIQLFHLLANVSGFNTDIQVLTDEDIVDIREE